MSTPPLKIGDRVQYMHVDARGRSMTLATREAVIVGFSKPTGRYAIVKARNNRKTQVPVVDLEPAGAPGPVDRVFRGLAAAADSAQAQPDLTPQPPAG